MKDVQPSFARGELSPSLHGRIDTAAYPTALKKCVNFVTRPTGGVVKRPGYRFRGYAKTNDVRTRLLPFIYSTETAYVVEMGAGYFRFWVNGAPLSVDGNPVEVASPYGWDDLKEVRITQSADVLYLAHKNHPVKELRRTGATSFALRDFAYKRGPFRALNPDESVVMAVSATQGNVTVTANANVFNANMVGQLAYMEEKELRSVRPWEPLDRSVTVGTTRRSDGKTYRAVTVTPASGAGTPYTITGNSRPTHEVGRAWDGPGDSRSDGVNSYAVGVEWEYVDSGYGIVKLTEYVSPTQMKGVVISTIPQSIVGTAPSPANQWTLSGDASAVTFPIAGASSPSQSDYRVTINGVPVQSNPYYEPTTGGSGTGGGALPGRGGETTNPYEQIEP